MSVIPEKENLCKEQEIRFERFHSGGKGSVDRIIDEKAEKAEAVDER